MQPKPRIRRGTQVKGGPVILKTTGGGGMRKIRCPSCHGTATLTARNDGQRVSRCGSCGLEMTTRAL